MIVRDNLGTRECSQRFTRHRNATRGGHDSAGNSAVCVSLATRPWSQVGDYACTVLNIAVLNIFKHRFDDLFQPYLEHDENCRSSSRVWSAAYKHPTWPVSPPDLVDVNLFLFMHKLLASVFANQICCKFLMFFCNYTVNETYLEPVFACFQPIQFCKKKWSSHWDVFPWRRELNQAKQPAVIISPVLVILGTRKPLFTRILKPGMGKLNVFELPWKWYLGMQLCSVELLVSETKRLFTGESRFSYQEKLQWVKKVSRHLAIKSIFERPGHIPPLQTMLIFPFLPLFSIDKTKDTLLPKKCRYCEKNC